MKAWRIIILLLVLGFVSAGQYSEKIRLVQPAQAAAPISAHVAPPDPQPVTATANLTSTSVIIITTAGFVPPVLTTTVGAEVSWYNGTNKTRVLQSGPCRQYLPIILKDGSSGATPSSEIPNLPSSPPAKVSSDDFSATLPPGGVFTHTFSLTGTHPYSLATAPQFCGQVIVQAASTPYVSLSATPGSGTVPLTVLYTVSASQLASQVLTYTWDFGDGITRTLALTTTGSVTASRFYPVAGVYTASVTVSDGQANASANQVIIVNEPVVDLPSDPADVAPPLDLSVATNLFNASAFLYSGDNPIQTGVAPGTIELRRVAVLRGRILNRNGDALPGVTITVHDHPEFGQTLSRADGMFDLAANGGGQLTLDYDRAGYLPAQRQVDVPWQDYAWLPDVVLIPLDVQVTPIDLTAPLPMQIAQGSVISDTAGIRQATLLFPQGTEAELVLPDGSTQPITSPLHVRATEYSVGNNGPEAMPAELPPNSAYTYALEFSLDEAIAAKATDVQFNQPVIFYVENFLSFEIGSPVPMGYYDRQKAIWVPSDSGRVVKILSINNGLAELDIDGSGVTAGATALAAMGITDPERQRLAERYQPNQSLWRVTITHFSPWDANWAFGPPSDAVSSNSSPPIGDSPAEGPCTAKGSTIQCQNQILGEASEVSGTPFTMHYQSDRNSGHKTAYSLDIPLSGSTVPTSLVRIELEIKVAGRTFNYSVEADLTNQRYSFIWDGRDSYGRVVQGMQPYTARIGYVYRGVYQKTDRFGYNGNGMITGSRTRNEVTLWQEWRGSIGPWDARPQGLGGWTFNVHHAYDPHGRTLYLGDGSRRSASSLGAIINSVAVIWNPQGLTAGPDGSVYVVDAGSRIYRIDPTGVVTRVAGTGVAGFSGDGGLATEAQLGFPTDVALAPDGSMYIADNGNNRIRRVSPDGIITTVAGNGLSSYSPDGTLATQAQLYSPFRIAIGPDSRLYILHRREQGNLATFVRRVEPDGILTTVVGRLDQGFGGCGGDGGPAIQAETYGTSDIAVEPDGSLFLTHYWCEQGKGVRRVTPDGIIKTVAGRGFSMSGYSGEGGLATEAILGEPHAVDTGPDGTFYFTDSYCVHRVGPDGLITTVAGDFATCNSGYGDRGDGDLATRALFGGVTHGIHYIALGPEGSLYISDSQNNRVRRVMSRLPGLSLSDILVPSEDGRQFYVFNGVGRHLRTLNALTGAVIYQFNYDPAGQLSSIQDGDGNLTTIERDGSGQPTAILAPFGQRTLLSLDANGYLASITNPVGAMARFTYTSDGLLTDFTDPRGSMYHFDYDSLGRLTQDADPAGGSKNLVRVSVGNNYTVTLTTALNRTTVYEVDNLTTGVQRRVNTFPGDIQSQTQFNVDGSQVVALPEGIGTTLVEGPDPRWGMQAPIVKNGTTSTPDQLTRNDATERTVNLTDPTNPLSLTSLTDRRTINGKTYTSIYDAAARTFTDNTPQGRQSLTTIDAQGRIVQEQAAGLLPNTYSYDPHGRLIAATTGTGPDTRTVSLAYNSQGYLASVTDPLSRTIQFEYDPAGRVTSQILPGDRTILYAYDANDNITSITPPGRPAHTFTYTPVDLTAMYQPPSVGAGSSQTRYDYNVDRQLMQITRPDGQTLDFGYDSAGRLTTLTTPHGIIGYSYQPTTGLLASVTAPGDITLAYGYDGMLTTRVAWSGPISGSVGYSYDNDFRLTALGINGSMTTTFQYNNDSLLTHAGDLTLSYDVQNGLLKSTALGSITDTWSYNGFGEVTNHRAAYTGMEIFKTDYIYDQLGRIITKTETISGIATSYGYSYDLAGRLSEVRQNSTLVAAYMYDDNGNRLNYSGPGGVVAGVYDDQDRLLQYGQTTYSYIANGELLTKIVGGQTTTYKYDELGNLLAVTLPDSTRIEYLIDGQNRRIGKKVNGVLVQAFLYQNQLNPVAELDGAGNVVSRFIYGSRTNVPDYMVKGGVTYRLIADHLGSPRLVVNTATGEVVQRMDYDEFGSVISDTNLGFQLFGFAGGLYDSDTGFVRFGARDYDAKVGRWTSHDPLHFYGGNLNLYNYVNNDAINLVDVDGMAVGFANSQLRDWWGLTKTTNPGVKKILQDLENDPTVRVFIEQSFQSDSSTAFEKVYDPLLKRNLTYARIIVNPNECVQGLSTPPPALLPTILAHEAGHVYDVAHSNYGYAASEHFARMLEDAVRDAFFLQPRTRVW